ncbi:glycosyltransferase [Paeniglutamicibacter sp. Y32M11]|nr:glycosyltransferase [Paeniglutamicibacter sp. Y32M11]
MFSPLATLHFASSTRSLLRYQCAESTLPFLDEQPNSGLSPWTPSVSAVITTCGRPEMLRDAVRSILAQDYLGSIEVVVVYDKISVDPLHDIEVVKGRTLRTMKNSRTTGLAGGRNTGILAASGEIIGFCDDDDLWLPDKLTRQLELWNANRSAIAISSGIRLRTMKTEVDRLAPAVSNFDDFLRSRITAIHPSTMIFLRSGFTQIYGLVDELLPAAYGEDYDLLLRATQHGPIHAVNEALVTVRWDRPSFFSGRWMNIIAGLTYVLQKFPEFEQDPRGLARIAGQVAFAHAALGNRTDCLHWIRSTLARDPFQPRAWSALVVALGLVKADTLLEMVQRMGRGL